MSQQNNSNKSQVWISWPGGIGWPTPIPLKGGDANMAGNLLPPGFKVNEQGVVAPPITVFNGGKRGRKSRRNNRKNRKNTRKNRKSNGKTRRNNRK